MEIAGALEGAASAYEDRFPKRLADELGGDRQLGHGERDG
jgi:hypothetical protein